MTELPHTAPRYVPIACAIYSELEVAIMHHCRLHLTWCQENVIFDQVVTPLDLKTAKGEEFLVCTLNSGETLNIRLDQLRRILPA